MARFGMSWSWVSGVRVTGSKCPTLCGNRTEERAVGEPCVLLSSPILQTLVKLHSLVKSGFDEFFVLKMSQWKHVRASWGIFYLQVLLDVFAVVGDAAGSDARLPHQLKADLSTQEVWDLTLLSNTKTNSFVLNRLVVRGLVRLRKTRRTITDLPLFIDLTEQLLQVRQVFVLQINK